MVNEAMTTVRGAAGRLVGGKYRLLRQLGRGGMGDVYEAEHAGIGTRVALKILRPETALLPDVMRRFQQEARSAATIGHPNIVTILDLDREADGTLYMVQELLSGVDLRGLLNRSKQLAPRDAVHLCMPVLSALAAAHDRGVLHRDLKPGNIFLCSSPKGIVPKVIDFGVAKVMRGESDTGQTREGMMIGTLSYMSPEQLNSDPTIDGRTDIWAMGVVLYEMLSGACPFPAPTGAAANPVAIARFAIRVSQEPAPRIEERVPGIPTDLAVIVHRALATDREARFQTMREFERALAGCSLGAREDASRTHGEAAADSTVIFLNDLDVSFVLEAAREAEGPQGTEAGTEIIAAHTPVVAPIPLVPLAPSLQSSPSSPSSFTSSPSGPRAPIIGLSIVAAGVLVLTAVVAFLVGSGRLVYTSAPIAPAASLPIPQPALARSPATVAPSPPPTAGIAATSPSSTAVVIAPPKDSAPKTVRPAHPEASKPARKSAPPVGTNGMPILTD